MKPLKRAEHKNFEVDVDVYTKGELSEIRELDGVFGFCNDTRVSTSFISDISVKCINGFYCNVAKHVSGREIVVLL